MYELSTSSRPKPAPEAVRAHVCVPAPHSPDPGVALPSKDRLGSTPGAQPPRMSVGTTPGHKFSEAGKEIILLSARAGCGSAETDPTLTDDNPTVVYADETCTEAGASEAWFRALPICFGRPGPAVTEERTPRWAPMRLTATGRGASDGVVDMKPDVKSTRDRHSRSADTRPTEPRIKTFRARDVRDFGLPMPPV